MTGQSAKSGIWIFAYGSLMWRPGFAYDACHKAVLHGYHRAFCVFSHVHRGTPHRPGLVLGLDRGGSCRGLAYHVAAEARADVRAYLRAREQVTQIYREAFLPVRLEPDRRRVEALCFVVDRAHAQYAGKLAFEDQVALIVGAVGRSGENPDYLANTVAHLQDMGIRDQGLVRLWQAVRRRMGERG